MNGKNQPEHRPNAGEILRFLEHADFPATKERLVNTATLHSATDDVLAALDAIPEREYLGPQDLADEIERSF